VKAGDALATIDTPSLDAQYAASKASLTVAQTRYHLAAITAKRWMALSGTQAVSQEDVDIKKADDAAQKAQVAAAQQDVARYAAMIGFKTLVAPFDGVVTVRNTNIGDYVNATGSNDARLNTPTALFQVADIHQVRIFVSVPQGYDDVLKAGLTATLTLPQDPDNPITLQFLTTANAVTQSTRTVVTEFTVDNTNGKLWPGTYANVHLTFPSDPNILILPEQALMFRAQGMQVAVLDDKDRVHLQNVTLGHNLDTEVQIISGLKATDRVIASPSAGLLEGQEVKIVQPVAGYRPGPAGQGAVAKKPVSASIQAVPGSTADAGPASPTPPASEKEPSQSRAAPISSSAAAESAGRPKPRAGTGQ
jgi:RND family efflux transporter MFP subunit